MIVSPSAEQVPAAVVSADCRSVMVVKSTPSAREQLVARATGLRAVARPRATSAADVAAAIRAVVLTGVPLLISCRCPERGVDRATWLGKRQPAVDAETEVARANPGTVIVDPVPVLCGTDTCLSAVDGVLRYQDETHLTVEGSLLLAPLMRAGLAEALTGQPAAQ